MGILFELSILSFHIESFRHLISKNKMSARLASNMLKCFTSRQFYRRNFGMTAVAFNEMDPVQKLFLDQVQKYKELSAAQGGGPVDAGAEYQQLKDDAIARLGKVYQVDDPLAFPTFEFAEPNLDKDEV